MGSGVVKPKLCFKDLSRDCTSNCMAHIGTEAEPKCLLLESARKSMAATETVAEKVGQLVRSAQNAERDRFMRPK